jgi:uncharacterized membrane protein YhhN
VKIGAPNAGAAQGAFIAGAAVAISFFLARIVEAPGLVAPLWKAAGIVLFGLSAAFAGAFLAAAALFASSAGDFFLELRPPHLVAGMAAFAIAHLFYIAAFARRLRRGGLDRRGVAPAAAVALISVMLFFWFRPGMGALIVPGLVYHAVLTAMVILALVAPVPRLARIGAVAFLISDTLIALGLYKNLGPFPLAIWGTYAAAQAMLARGLSEKAV